jgi:hypothetical protein
VEPPHAAGARGRDQGAGGDRLPARTNPPREARARVEHIGSTAVPGSLTKGDLDICDIVPADPELRARYDRLKQEHADGPIEDYRTAKERLIASVGGLGGAEGASSGGG